MGLYTRAAWRDVILSTLIIAGPVWGASEANYTPQRPPFERTESSRHRRRIGNPMPCHGSGCMGRDHERVPPHDNSNGPGIAIGGITWPPNPPAGDGDPPPNHHDSGPSDPPQQHLEPTVTPEPAYTAVIAGGFVLLAAIAVRRARRAT